jgi:hypothetical protein
MGVLKFGNCCLNLFWGFAAFVDVICSESAFFFFLHRKSYNVVLEKKRKKSSVGTGRWCSRGWI